VLLVEEDSMLATCVPAKAKRNMVVPTNSPIVATKSVHSLVRLLKQKWRMSYGS
jgi:hypothetical protein